ncbi:DUF1983 domain-containing protein [Xenorhabdus bovienii]|nr:DUF1983 domain-containing protein [Xenorhabdus bovienii]
MCQIRLRLIHIKGDRSALYDVGAGLKYKGQFYKAGMVIGAEVKNGQVTTSIGFNANNFGWFNPAQYMRTKLLVMWCL